MQRLTCKDNVLKLQTINLLWDQIYEEESEFYIDIKFLSPFLQQIFAERN